MTAAAKGETTNRGEMLYAPSTMSKRVEGPRTTMPRNGGGMGINEDIESGRWSRCPDNPFTKSPIPPSGTAGLKDSHILNSNAMPKGGDVESGGDSIRAPEALPSFEELSRWRISRGTVTKMARLATAVRGISGENRS